MAPTSVTPMVNAIHVEIPEVARDDPVATQVIALMRMNRFDIL